MKIPSPPNTDEEIQRHKFYGAMSSALECLQEKIQADEIHITDNTKGLHDKHNQLKELIEEVNGRINKKTYKEDFQDLENKVDDLYSKEVEHRTSWKTGKMFLIGAWLVSSILISWGYTITSKDIFNYNEITLKNEKEITSNRHEHNEINKTLDKFTETKEEVLHELEVIEEKNEYLERKLKDLWQEVNTLNGKHLEVDEKHKK